MHLNSVLLHTQEKCTRSEGDKTKCLLQNQSEDRGPNIISMLMINFDCEGTVHQTFLQARQLNSNSAQIFGSILGTKLIANIHNDGRTQIH